MDAYPHRNYQAPITQLWKDGVCQIPTPRGRVIVLREDIDGHHARLVERGKPGPEMKLEGPK